MRHPLRLSLALLPLLAATARGNPGVFVHKVDDSVVAGELTTVADGKLTVTVKGIKTVVPLDEVTQVTTTEQQPTTAPAAAAPAPQNRKGGGLLAALFGITEQDEANAGPDTTPPPAPQPPAPAGSKPLPPATTRATADVTWQLVLTDGDTLHATVVAWAGPKLTVRPTGLADQPSIDLPTDRIAEMWAGSVDAVAKARAVAVPAGPEDVAYVQKDAEVIAVRGVATGIDGDALAFKYDDQNRKIGLGRLVGVVFRGNARQPLHGFHQVVRTTAGDVLSGQWVGLTGKDGSAVSLRLTSGATLAVPFKQVAGVDCVDGRQVWLSALVPTLVEQTPYFGRVMPYQVDHSLTGGPITLADGPHVHGIAVHSRCVLSYDLSAAGGFDGFKCKLGFEQPAGRIGRVAARVVGDGKVLWANDDARGDAPPIDLDVKLTGVRKLVLDVDFGQGQDVGDRVVWADVRLLRAAAK